MFHVTIKMSDNSGLTHTFEWVDSTGTPISLLGRTLKSQVKRRLGDSQVVLEMSTTNSLIVIDPVETHKFTLKVPANRLKATPMIELGAEADDPYVFDMLDIVSADERPLLMRGEIHVFKGVTQ